MKLWMFLAGVCGGIGLAPLRADEPAGRTVAAAPSLVGTWKLVRASYGGAASDLPTRGTTLKHITPTHSIWVSYDATGALIRSAGGPYRFDGATLRNTPEFGMSADFDAIRGREQSYQVTFEGNRFHQVGTLSNGTELDEVWERVEAATPPTSGPPIDATRAIALAEQFIRDNGYTDFVPPDPSRLTAESIEHFDRPDWAAHRHGTLRPRALGYLTGGKAGAAGWTIAFGYAQPGRGRESGRAVTMDERGANLRVEHKDLWLTNPDLRPR